MPFLTMSTETSIGPNIMINTNIKQNRFTVSSFMILFMFVRVSVCITFATLLNRPRAPRTNNLITLTSMKNDFAAVRSTIGD